MRPRSQYYWENGVRISSEDGTRLLKTQEAAELLAVPVNFVRELVKKGHLPVRAHYSVYGGQKGWLVSEKDVLALSNDPETEEKRRAYSQWKEKRAASAAKLEVMPKAQVRPLKRKRVVKPDTFQLRAVEAALAGSDVLVVAPTGAGKTWVAKELARHALKENEKFVYASPIKALSNQVYRDFFSCFGEESVGIVTGDISINPNAQITVMTTEIFRNRCLAGDAGDVKWAVIDEFHLLDSNRGTAWEEAVIFAPSDTTLAYLSATIPNAEEIAGWLTWARGKRVEVVRSDVRPVPLQWRWYVGKKVYTEKTAGRRIGQLEDAKERLFDDRFVYGSGRWRDSDDWEDDWDDNWDDDD